MYTSEQYEQLEQEERTLTDEAILLMIAILALYKSNLENELRQFYSKYGRDGVVTWQEARKWVGNDDHRRRLTVLLFSIGDNFDKLYESLTPEFKKMLSQIIAKEAEFFDVEIDEDIMDKNWGADDSNWSDRLVDDVILWSAYLENDVKQAIIKQLTIDQLMTQVDKRFDSIGKVLEKLGLTESTAVGSLARREVMKELVVTRYRFYTRADERTCEVCGAMHGIEFPISAYEVGVTASPLHPFCRCWEVLEIGD